MNKLTAIENNPQTALTDPARITWFTHHNDAVQRAPGYLARTPERAIVNLILAWQEYAEAHRQKYDGDLIGNDGYAGQSWQSIGAELVHLLSMDHGGRLDGGTLDAAIRNIAKDHGIEEEA